MIRPRAAGLLALGLVLGQGVVAPAATPEAPAAAARVAVAPGKDDDPVVTEARNRVRFELAANGLLASAAPAGAGDFVVTIARTGAGFIIEVNALTARGPSTHPRRVDVAAGTGPEAGGIVAIRAVELVRAAMLQSAVVAEAPTTPVGAATAATTVAAAATVESPAPRAVSSAGGPRWSLAIGAVGLQSFRGFGAALGPVARVALQASSAIFVSLQLAAPLVARDLHAADGGASLRQVLAGVAVGYAFRPDRTLRPALSLAGGLYHLAVVGHAQTGRAISPALSAPYAAAGAGLTFAPRASSFAVRLQADAIFVTPAPYVSIGAVDAGHAGRPMLLATLEAEWRFSRGSLR